MSSVGERIRELRIKNQMTLDDVARHLGVGRQAIYKYEQGTVTNIPLENIVKMSDLFNVSPQYLAGWTIEPSPFEELDMRYRPYDFAIPPRDFITPNETRLIDLYRGADSRARKDAIRTLEEHQIKKEDPDVK